MSLSDVAKSRLQNIDIYSYEVLIDKFYYIMDKIEFGIELENGKKREFDILDYMDNSALEFIEYLNLAQLKREKEVKDVEIFLNFLRKYKDPSDSFRKSRPDSIFNRPEEFEKYKLDPETIIKVNFKKVNNKYKVIKENRVFSKTEIKEIFDFLNEEGYPINRLTYNAVMNRMKNNTFKKDVMISSRYKLTNYEKIKRNCVDEEIIEASKQKTNIFVDQKITESHKQKVKVR